MLVNHDDLLDHESSQGFEINDSTCQRLIGYVKAEIASQAHFYNHPLDEKIDPIISQADDIEFDGLLFSFINNELSVNVTTSIEQLMGESARLRSAASITISKPSLMGSPPIVKKRALITTG